MVRSHITPELDVTSGACLVLIHRGAGHGYDVARHFAIDGSLGPVLTLSRPVVYRAVKWLESAGFVKSVESAGARGQLKWQLTCTQRGREAAETWLATPVTHIRDMRSDFLVKYILTPEVGGQRADFVRRQRDVLVRITATLLSNRGNDAVSVWRREQARAAMRFLDELEGSSTVVEIDDAKPIELSARNQLRATVISVKHGDILSSIRIEVAPDQTMTSTITREAVDELRLSPGTRVVALCKATDVMIGTDQSTMA
jgi:molybdopterin-binding protein